MLSLCDCLQGHNDKAENVSPQSIIGGRIEVDTIARHLLTEGQDQSYEVH